MYSNYCSFCRLETVKFFKNEQKLSYETKKFAKTIKEGFTENPIASQMLHQIASKFVKFITAISFIQNFTINPQTGIFLTAVFIP